MIPRLGDGSIVVLGEKHIIEEGGLENDSPSRGRKF